MIELEQDVMVVEDDPEINELIGAYAKIAGFGYQPALRGDVALNLARQRQPALIVLDIMLPDIDGFSICLKLKENPLTADIPIVFVTAMTDPDHRRLARECGAVEYLTKPFDPEQLMDVMRRNARRPAQADPARSPETRPHDPANTG